VLSALLLQIVDYEVLQIQSAVRAVQHSTQRHCTAGLTCTPYWSCFCALVQLRGERDGAREQLNGVLQQLANVGGAQIQVQYLQCSNVQ
jgi:hypothetical protein